MRAKLCGKVAEYVRGSDSAINMVYCSQLTHIQKQAALHDCLPKLLGDENT